MKNVKLVLGTMTFGESVFSSDVEAFVNMFLDAGYEELDTAYVYNDGNCERLLGEVLPHLKKTYKIATSLYMNDYIDANPGQGYNSMIKEKLDINKFSSRYSAAKTAASF